MVVQEMGWQAPMELVEVVVVVEDYPHLHRQVVEVQE
jgi:hypothetical protein